MRRHSGKLLACTVNSAEVRRQEREMLANETEELRSWTKRSASVCVIDLLPRDKYEESKWRIGKTPVSEKRRAL